jgi:hypothetical protein
MFTGQLIWTGPFDLASLSARDTVANGSDSRVTSALLFTSDFMNLAFSRTAMLLVRLLLQFIDLLKVNSRL